MRTKLPGELVVGDILAEVAGPLYDVVVVEARAARLLVRFPHLDAEGEIDVVIVRTSLHRPGEQALVLDPRLPVVLR